MGWWTSHGWLHPCFNGEIPGEFAMACHGEAWLMEIHPTLAIKSPGLGDPEAGWVPSKFCHGVGQFTGVFFSERNGKVIFGMIGEFGPGTPWNLGFGVIFFRNEALSWKTGGIWWFWQAKQGGSWPATVESCQINSNKGVNHEIDEHDRPPGCQSQLHYPTLSLFEFKQQRDYHHPGTILKCGIVELYYPWQSIMDNWYFIWLPLWYMGLYCPWYCPQHPIII